MKMFWVSKVKYVQMVAKSTSFDNIAVFLKRPFNTRHLTVSSLFFSMAMKQWWGSKMDSWHFN